MVVLDHPRSLFDSPRSRRRQWPNGPLHDIGTVRGCGS